MGIALAGLLIIGVLFSGALIIFRSDLLGNLLVTDAIKETSQLTGEQVRTRIDLTAVSIDTGDGNCNLTVTGDNTGSTSIADLDQMDAIVQFTTGDNLPQSLTYVTGDTPSATDGTGDWAKRSISGQFEPGIWNPDEELVLKGILDVSLGTVDTFATVTVSTPNGVTDTFTTTDVFSVPCLQQ